MWKVPTKAREEETEVRKGEKERKKETWKERKSDKDR
jgi:hypothetical protein